jgi:hypothetical protein
MATTSHIQNQIPTKAISNMTLKEVWCEYKPSISHLHTFGCVAFVHVSKETRTKLDSKGVKCIFIIYYEEIKGYKLYNPISQYVIIFFDETRNFNKEQWFQGWILHKNIWFYINIQICKMKKIPQ